MKILSLAIDPGSPCTLYAGSLEGSFLHKSTNCGGSWSPSSDGLAGTFYVYSLAIYPQDPDTLYAGTYRGVFKSTNAGTS